MVNEVLVALMTFIATLLLDCLAAKTGKADIFLVGLFDAGLCVMVRTFAMSRFAPKVTSIICYQCSFSRPRDRRFCAG
jgi:hypothetical protein